jgi:hypothetical protein
MAPPDLLHDPSADTYGFNHHMADSSPVPTEQPAPEVNSIPLEGIEIDEGLQTRVQLDPDTIDAYAEDMRHGAILPAIDVYEKDTGGDIHYLLVDGRHRLEAAKRIDATRIFARVYQGNRRDALIHAAGANSKNGLRRTNADKQKTVKMLLGDEELVQWSDSELGRMAGVHRDTVSHIRKQLEASCEIRMIEEKKVTSNSKVEQLDNGEPPIHLPQAEDGEGTHDENPQLRLAAPPTSDPQPKQDQDQDIEAAQRHDKGAPAESQEADSHCDNTGSEPEKSDCGKPHEPPDTPSDELPELNASQAPLLALQCFYDGAEGDVRDLRARYACNDCVDSRIKRSLDCFAEGLQHARHILVAATQHAEPGRIDLEVAESATTAPDEPGEQDDLYAQGSLPSSETSLTTAEPLDPAAVVQDFVKRRCTPSSDPVSHTDVMTSINTWLDDQRQPRLKDNEVIRELKRLGFHDFNNMVSKKVETNAGWQWQGFQLLPLDAPDNKVDPFSSPNA